MDKTAITVCRSATTTSRVWQRSSNNNTTIFLHQQSELSLFQCGHVQSGMKRSLSTNNWKFVCRQLGILYGFLGFTPSFDRSISTRLGGSVQMPRYIVTTSKQTSCRLPLKINGRCAHQLKIKKTQQSTSSEYLSVTITDQTIAITSFVRQ